jgi:hypothetical protein
MATKSDRAAGSRQTAGASGASAGFLAEEEHLDRAALLRLGTWGAAAVAAVIVAILANQSSMKLRREQVAAADLARQTQQIQSVARQSENEVRRLASAVDTLNGDRDRLFSRMSVLEQGLDSVTGSIVRQSAAAAPQPASPAPAPPLQPVAQNPAPTPAAAAPIVVSAAAPVADPVATSRTAGVEKPTAEARSPDQTPAPKPAATVEPGPSTPPTAPPTPPATPLIASKSMLAPPDAAAEKLTEPEPPAKLVATAPSTPVPTTPALPVTVPAPAETAKSPVRLASTPPDKADGKAGANEAGANTARGMSPALTVKRTEFGVDIGGANSVGGLRALWRGLLKSRSNAPLTKLQPIIVIKEGSNGLGMQLRLVAGPLTDAAAAARICANLIANQRPCETTVYDGQRLPIKAEQSSISSEAVQGKSESDRSDPSRRDPSKPDPAKSASSDPEAAKPVAAKPAGKSTRSGWHRRSPPQRVTVEEPPKPEPSMLSSIFGRRANP